MSVPGRIEEQINQKNVKIPEKLAPCENQEASLYTKGVRGHTPIILLLIKKDTIAVSASAIQNAFHTPTAPKK